MHGGGYFDDSSVDVTYFDANAMSWDFEELFRREVDADNEHTRPPPPHPPKPVGTNLPPQSLPPDMTGCGPNIQPICYKSKLCRNFNGKTKFCPYGDRCMYAHGPDDLRTPQMNREDRLYTKEAIKRHIDLQHMARVNLFKAAGRTFAGVDNTCFAHLPSAPPPPPFPGDSAGVHYDASGNAHYASIMPACSVTTSGVSASNGMSHEASSVGMSGGGVLASLGMRQTSLSEQALVDKYLAFTPDTQGSLYKTQLCRNHLSEDGCRYGKACNFAHGEGELRLVRDNMLYHEVIRACDALKENIKVARTVMNAEDVLGARLPVSNAPLPVNTVADAPPAYPTMSETDAASAPTTVLTEERVAKVQPPATIMNETDAASAPTTVLTEERVANAVPPATTVADAPPSPMKQSADASAPTTVVTARLLPCHASSVPLNLFRDVRPSTDCLRENLVVRTPLYGDLPLPRLVENAPHW